MGDNRRPEGPMRAARRERSGNLLPAGSRLSAELMPPLTARSRNLVRFARHLPEETLDASFAADFSFRDAGSRFSILKSAKTAPGPDECFGLWARDDRTVFRKLLGLQVTYEGLNARQQAAVSPYNSMNYYRSHISETFCHNGIEPMPPTEGECVMWYAAADVLCIRYRIVNKALCEVPVRLEWSSEGEPGEGFSAEPTGAGFLFENRATVIQEPYTSRAELLANDGDIRFAVEENTLRSTPVARVIPAGGAIECRFAVRFCFNDEAMPEWPADLWADTSLERAIEETENAYAKLPPLDPAFERHRDLVLKAAGTLRSLRYCDYDANRKRCLTMHVSKSGTAATWFWDTGVSLPGLGLMGEREAAVGAARILLAGIRPDGTPPVTYEHQRYLYSYQIPLVAWGLGHYLASVGDDVLLAEAYGPLARYVRHWVDGFSTRHGLMVYPQGCTSLDDALRWHSGSPLTPSPGTPWQAQEWGRPQQHLYASPDINAFLYLEMCTLAEMARALQKPDDAASWNEEAERLAAAINAWFIEPETRTYQDRQVETGIFNGMISLGSFIPVYAGIAPREVADVLCRDYLLSPEHFLTTMPFPVIDRAHPTFRSGGFLHAPPSQPGSLVQQSYWRGRTWIHGDCWLLGALWQSGFQEEADQIADQILEAVSRSEGIHECYDSLTGYGNGHPEFLWSSAAVLMVAYRFYRLPPAARI